MTTQALAILPYRGLSALIDNTLTLMKYVYSVKDKKGIEIYTADRLDD